MNKDINQTVIVTFLFLCVFAIALGYLGSFVVNEEREILDTICIAEYGIGSYVVKTGRFGDPLCFSARDKRLMGFPPSKR